ncbi:MAG: hypothetical protein ACOCVK_02400 [bacterium]
MILAAILRALIATRRRRITEHRRTLWHAALVRVWIRRGYWVPFSRN